MSGNALVENRETEFTWYPGMSLTQKRRSIASLHVAVEQRFGVTPILEVSSKSSEKLGIELSAFNLSFPIKNPDRRVSVESAYQGSKVFEHGGPYTELYGFSSRDAKRYRRLQESGRITGFRFFRKEWPLEPPTAFYDWLYINALKMNEDLVEEVGRYNAFTDIEFNPRRSINCQANSVALFLALKRRGLLNNALDSQDSFIAILSEYGHSSAGDAALLGMSTPTPDNRELPGIAAQFENPTGGN